MNDLSTILEKIKNLRIQNGISQTEMAKSLGITQAGYANIENNDKGKLSIAIAVGIAEILKVGFNELYDIDGDSQKIETLDHEIEILKNRIKELEEQLNDKRRLVDFIENDDVLVSIAREIQHKIEGFDPVKRDFDDLDSLIKELEDKGPFDRNSRKSVFAYVMKHIDILQYNPKTD
jgi:transcriptional regulator with XRE-family HTH domain